MTSLSKFFKSRLLIFVVVEGEEEVKKAVNEFEVVDGKGTAGKRLPPAEEAIISAAELEEEGTVPVVDDEDGEPANSCVSPSFDDNDGFGLAEDNIFAPIF